MPPHPAALSCTSHTTPHTPRKACFAFHIGKLFQQHFVEKPFDDGGHIRPPDRENKNQTAAFFNHLLVFLHRRIKHLPLVEKSQLFFTVNGVETAFVRMSVNNGRCHSVTPKQWLSQIPDCAMFQTASPVQIRRYTSSNGNLKCSPQIPRPGLRMPQTTIILISAPRGSLRMRLTMRLSNPSSGQVS